MKTRLAAVAGVALAAACLSTAEADATAFCLNAKACHFAGYSQSSSNPAFTDLSETLGVASGSAADAASGGYTVVELMQRWDSKSYLAVGYGYSRKAHAGAPRAFWIQHSPTFKGKIQWLDQLTVGQTESVELRFSGGRWSVIVNGTAHQADASIPAPATSAQDWLGLASTSAASALGMASINPILPARNTQLGGGLCATLPMSGSTAGSVWIAPPSC